MFQNPFFWLSVIELIAIAVLAFIVGRQQEKLTAFEEQEREAQSRRDTLMTTDID